MAEQVPASQHVLKKPKKISSTIQKYINMAGQLNRAVDNPFVPDVLKKETQ